MSDIFAESRGTAVGIYNTCLLGSFSSIINYTIGNSVSPDVLLFFRGITSLLGTFVAVVALFGPKFAIIIKKKDVNIQGSEVESEKLGKYK